MTDGTYTLYSSTTCTRCPLARKSIERAGAEYDEHKLDLPENEMMLIALKGELGKAPDGMIPLPIVRTPDGRLLDNLATISAEFRERYAA